MVWLLNVLRSIFFSTATFLVDISIHCHLFLKRKTCIFDPIHLGWFWLKTSLILTSRLSGCQYIWYMSLKPIHFITGHFDFWWAPFRELFHVLIVVRSVANEQNKLFRKQTNLALELTFETYDPETDTIYKILLLTLRTFGECRFRELHGILIMVRSVVNEQNKLFVKQTWNVSTLPLESTLETTEFSTDQYIYNIKHEITGRFDFGWVTFSRVLQNSHYSQISCRWTE